MDNHAKLYRTIGLTFIPDFSLIVNDIAKLNMDIDMHYESEIGEITCEYGMTILLPRTN